MLPSTAQYKTHLHGPHRRDARIDAFDINGTVLAQDVPIVEGVVQASVSNRVARTASFTLTDEWYPRAFTDAFAPELSVVKIRAGVRYGDGTRELFPLFTGRVATVTRNSDGSVSFEADDLMADVVAFRFEQPQVTRVSAGVGTPAQTVLREIEQLVTEALPSAVFGTHGVADALVPFLTWDEDRGQAVDDLAAALGGRLLVDGDGVFSVQPVDYSPGTPVQEFLDGPGGLLSQANTSRTRDGVANSVTVVSERSDGTDPVRVTVRDTAPASPTFFGGTFGKVSQIVKVQTPLAPSEAQRTARALLQAGVALTEQWSVNVVADHTIELSDLVRFRYRGIVADQVVDSITYPLTTGDIMSMGTRGTVVVQDA